MPSVLLSLAVDFCRNNSSS